MKPVFIAFGANLSNPKESFLSAIDLLREEGVEVLAFSRLWQSPAWPPGSNAPDYINAVARVDYKGPPEALMQLLLDIEAKLGRVRSEKNAPRTLDLDLLIWGDATRQTDNLTLPHPRMFDRAFVLLPIHDIAPDWRDPWLGRTAMEHLARLSLDDVMMMQLVGALNPVANTAKWLLQST